MPKKTDKTTQLLTELLDKLKNFERATTTRFEYFEALLIAQFAEINEKFNGNSRAIGLISTRVNVNSKDLELLSTRVHEIYSKIDAANQKITNIDTKLSQVEANLTYEIRNIGTSLMYHNHQQELHREDTHFKEDVLKRLELLEERLTPNQHT